MTKKKEPIRKDNTPVNLLEVEIETETKYLLNWIAVRRKINSFSNLFRRRKR